MPLQFQIIHAPFRLGLQEGIEPHQTPFGTLLRSNNLVWRKSGLLEKRDGTRLLSKLTTKGTPITAAHRIFTRGSELCAIDAVAGKLYAWSGTQSRWIEVDDIPDVGLTWGPLLDTHAGVAASDFALSSHGYRIQAWTAGDATGDGIGSIFVQVIDRDGAVLVAPRMLASGNLAFPRVRVVGSMAFFWWKNSTTIHCQPLDLATMTFGSDTTVCTDIHGGSGFDVCVIGTNQVIAYTNTTPVLQLRSYNASLTETAASTLAGATGISINISIDGAAGESLYVAYYGTGGGGAFQVVMANPSTLAQTVAPVVIEGLASGFLVGSVARYDATSCIAIYTIEGTGGLPGRTVSYRVSASGKDMGSERGTWGTSLVSRPFVLNGRAYAFFADYPFSGTKSNFIGVNTLLMGLEVEDKGETSSYVPHRYVGKIDHLVGARFAWGSVSSVAAESATSLYACIPYLSDAPSAPTVWRTGCKLVNITTGAALPPGLFGAVTYGQESYLPGALLGAYDGRSVFDYGFARAPVWVSISAGGESGHLQEGDYVFGAIQEYRSNAGVLHRSATTQVAEHYNIGWSATHTWAGCNVTAKQDLRTGFGSPLVAKTLLVLFRSEAGQGTPHRMTIEPVHNVVAIDARFQSMTIPDDNPDNDIGDGIALGRRPLIYTAGGILDDDQPVAQTDLAFHKGRLWAITGDRRTVWFSKSFDDDLGVAPGFSSGFRISFDEDLTGLIPLDEKLVVFSEHSIWIVAGGDMGPAPSGQNSDIQSPFAVQADVGAINSRSIVGTPDGVVFQSTRGLYLLDRGLQLIWFGRPVKDQLAAFPNITSAVVVASQNQVRWTCNNDAGTAGIVLVYDYVEKQWTTFSYTDGANTSTPIASACMWQGQWTFVTPSGQVHVEDTTTHLDAGTHWVKLTLETADYSAAGPLGYVSVRNFGLAGTSHSHHDLNLWAAFDSETTPSQGPRTFAAQGAVTEIGPLEQCRLSVGTRRKCQSIRFVVEDAPPTTGAIGTGKGPSFNHMAIEVGVKKGLRAVSRQHKK